MRDLEADPRIPNTAVSEILMQDLGTKRVVAKFVLQFLLSEEKKHRTAVANDLIQTTTNEPDFLKVTNRDEWWVDSLDLVRKALLLPMEVTWFSTHEGDATKLHQDQDHVNCVFYWKGVVHHQVYPPGQTMNTEYFLDVLCRLRLVTR